MVKKLLYILLLVGGIFLGGCTPYRYPQAGDRVLLVENGWSMNAHPVEATIIAVDVNRTYFQATTLDGKTDWYAFRLYTVTVIEIQTNTKN